jgi:hypothetical protein
MNFFTKMTGKKDDRRDSVLERRLIEEEDRKNRANRGQ